MGLTNRRAALQNRHQRWLTDLGEQPPHCPHGNVPTMNSINGDAFIIISGPPQKGKRERISQVRSHITKRYFQRQNLRTVGLSQHKQSPKVATSCMYCKHDSLRRAVQPSLPPEIASTILSPDHPMLNSGYLLSETTRRMQKCKSDLHISIRGNCQMQKFSNEPLCRI